MTARGFLSALVALVAASCSGDSTGPDQPPTATSLRLEPTSVSLAALGATSQLSAQVLDQHGKAMNGVAVSWPRAGRRARGGAEHLSLAGRGLSAPSTV